MAAAYDFHISENQPFIDGNKRTAVAAALSFLDACNIALHDESGALSDAMTAVRTQKLSKDGLEKLLAELAGNSNE